MHARFCGLTERTFRGFQLCNTLENYARLLNVGMSPGLSPAFPTWRGRHDYNNWPAEKAFLWVYTLTLISQRKLTGSHSPPGSEFLLVSWSHPKLATGLPLNYLLNKGRGKVLLNIINELPSYSRECEYLYLLVSTQTPQAFHYHSLTI